MNVETLLKRINQREEVVAECKGTELIVRVRGFRPLFVRLDSPTYNADYLPPMPPLEEGYNYNPASSEVWDDIMSVLREYWSD